MCVLTILGRPPDLGGHFLSAPPKLSANRRRNADGGKEISLAKCGRWTKNFSPECGRRTRDFLADVCPLVDIFLSPPPKLFSKRRWNADGGQRIFWWTMDGDKEFFGGQKISLADMVDAHVSHNLIIHCDATVYKAVSSFYSFTIMSRAL